MGSGSNVLQYYTSMVINDDTDKNRVMLKRVIKGMCNIDFSKQLIQLSPTSPAKLSMLARLNK